MQHITPTITVNSVISIWDSIPGTR